MSYVLRWCARAVVLVGLLACAPAAEAGTYTVVACNSAPGGVNNAWRFQSAANSPATWTAKATHACPAGAAEVDKGMGVVMSATPPSFAATATPSALVAAAALPPRAGSSWGRLYLEAPPGTDLRGLTASFMCRMPSPSPYYWGLQARPSGAMLGRTCNATSFTTQTATFVPGTTSLDYFLECQSTQSFCARLASPRIAMARADVTIGDASAPSVSVVNGNLPAGWASNDALVVFNASDNVGIREARLLVDNVARGSVSLGCDYTLLIPCSNQQDAGLSASLTGIPEGTHTWQLEVRDAAGNPSLTPARSFTINRRAPDVHIDGILYERRATPLVPDSYDITVDAVSADPTRASSGVVEVRVLVDGAVVKVAGNDEPCVGADCDVDTRYDLEAHSMTGVHSIEVRATDAAGNVRSVPWTVNFSATPTPLPPVPLSLSASPSQSGAVSGCDFTKSADAGLLIDERPRAVAHRRWRSGQASGAETTERFAGGRYRVTRCSDSGELVISQLVGPVRVPGGVALLELGRTMPEGDGYGTSVPEYADPEDPAFQRAWRTGRRAALATVIAPAIK